MLLIIVVTFTVLLVVTFGVVLLLTRPSAAERAIQGRVASIAVSDSPTIYIGDLPEFFKRTKLSEIDWLDNLLQRWNYAHTIRLLISQAESNWTVGIVLLLSAGCAIIGFCVADYYLPEPAIAGVLGILCSTLPFFYLQFLRARRLRRFNAALPDGVELIIRALRAGYSVGAAIEIVGQEASEPVKTEFREVYKQENFGLPHREALMQLARRVPSPDLQFVVTAMLVQKETGGNLVDILERTVNVIRERLRIEGEIRIYTAQGRLTGVILALLPIVMFFLINIANHGYTQVLLDDPLGRKLIYIGAGSMMLGGLVIRKIVNVKI